jgi:hypothetical protein
LSADFIVLKVQCGECLRKIVSDLVNTKKNNREWCYLVLLKSIG